MHGFARKTPVTTVQSLTMLSGHPRKKIENVIDGEKRMYSLFE